MPDVETRTIIAGSGGQGILFLGKALAVACMREGRHVTWFPSYGAEMRGGTANCTVVLSDEMIGSPVVLRPDILIVMNLASLQRFLPSLRRKGLLLYDSSLIETPLTRRGIEGLPVPATDLANVAGNIRSANMVMLGALTARTELVRKATVLSLFDDAKGADESRAGINVSAFLKGYEYGEGTKSGHRGR